MRYIKMVTAFSLICVFQASPALAADWSGFYAGIVMNSITVETDWTTLETRDPGGVEIPTTSDPTASLESTETGVGVILGYNWNFGSWVIGVEGSGGRTEHDDTIGDRIPGLGNSSSDPTSSVNVKIQTDGMALRFRGGYLLTPDLLLYGSYGNTDLDFEITSTCPGDTNVCNPSEGDRSFTNPGDANNTAIGVGVEYAINRFLSHEANRLVVRLQYSAVDFGTSNGFIALPDDSGSSFGADAKTGFEATYTQLGLTYAF
jgi:outer membrane immunogenic protein